MAETLNETLGKALGTLASVAAPFTTIASLIFVGACYFSGYIYRIALFREYGLSPNIVSSTIQDTVSLGFINFIGLGLWAIAFSMIFVTIRIIFVPKRVEVKAVELLPAHLEKSSVILNRLFLALVVISVAAFGGISSYEIEKAISSIQPCNRCAVYHTSKLIYTGRVIGQDATTTVLIVDNAALLIKTPDILSVRKYTQPKTCAGLFPQILMRSPHCRGLRQGS